MLNLNFKRLASFMVVLALTGTSAVGGTLARYTSATSGSDTATVAKWELTINDDNFTDFVEDTWTFDLFKTINEDDTTTPETAVSSGYIAPGTGGSFKMTVKNTSHVDATYTLNFAETNASGVPLQYSLDGKTWYDDMTDINANRTDVAIERETGSVEQTVYWRWCFDGGSDAHAGQSNSVDTDLGSAAQSSAPVVTIRADLTATQVDMK